MCRNIIPYEAPRDCFDRKFERRRRKLGGRSSPGEDLNGFGVEGHAFVLIGSQEQHLLHLMRVSRQEASARIKMLEAVNCDMAVQFFIEGTKRNAFVNPALSM